MARKRTAELFLPMKRIRDASFPQKWSIHSSFTPMFVWQPEAALHDGASDFLIKGYRLFAFV